MDIVFQSRGDAIHATVRVVAIPPFASKLRVSAVNVDLRVFVHLAKCAI
jgi:hypothetical protein